ncbi:Gamma-aminobutyric acid type B receptor subunit 2 [Trichoplax sp. H2]|nr:Gamma-aminobutyric acid type B receptor subunit 2 [Trichoplax sp. H2]|eukprot:RDD36137.1 Gamma-aminobutyric acid type B receptor subunit 2 [Trichoplax sp. H2]
MTFFKHFNWKKAGIVHSSFGTYPKLALLVKQEMSKENIEVAVVESIDRDGTFAVNSLKAYHKGYYGSKYVWWFPGWFRSNWWRDTYGTYNCSSNEIFEVIGNNSFYTTTPIYSTSNTTAVSGKTGIQFFNDLNKSMNYTFVSSGFADKVGAIYDAVWSLALGLHRSERYLKNINSSLEHFTYDNDLIRSAFVKEISNLSFYGVTGPISFKKGNSRLGNVIIWQLQDSLRKVAFYDIENNKISIENDSLKWPGGKPPQDRLIVIVVIKTIPKALFIPFSILNCLGIIFSLIIMVFIAVKRRNRYIKMSSPNLNYFILFGCILCYISVIVNGMDAGIVGVKNRKHTCIAEIWLLSLGFTIAFGSIIKDLQLIIRLGQLLLVDVLILILWNIIDPISTNDVDVGVKIHNHKEIIRDRIQVCTSTNSIVWLIAILAYKSAMLLFGVSLAWRTRKVSIETLNDSRSLVLTIYNIFVLSFTGVTVGMVSNNTYDIGFALKAAFIILCTTSSICLVFIPKLLQVRINPTLPSATTKTDNKFSNNMLSTSISGEAQLEVRKLRLIIREQEEKLQKLSNRTIQETEN